MSEKMAGRQGMLDFGAQKGGRLFGGAATAEVLESSRGVLAPNQHGEIKGLQQFYTPPQAAEWIAQVSGRRHPTVDLTAGDGALLAPLEASCRYGVEIDRDQVQAAESLERPYRALRGDLQQLYPMLAALGAKFRVALLNPPFGLPWSVPGLGEGNSAELTVRMARALLSGDGMGAVICGAERFERELRGLLGNALFAVVRVERLFRGTKVPCSIAFWREAKLEEWRKGDVLEARVEDVDGLTSELAGEVSDAGEARFGYWFTSPVTYAWQAQTGSDLGAIWSAVQQEHDTRRAGKAREAEGVSLKGGKLRVKLSPYATLAAVKEGNREQLTWLQGFDRQPPNYFALRPREWNSLRRACERYSVPLSPAVVAEVEEVLEAAKQVTCPLYPVSPAQRLAFLVDLAEIRCVAGDESKGYEAGAVYPIACSTQVRTATETREKETLKGPEEYQVVVERRAMQIQIGPHTFDEGPEAMEYILGHFDVPDPGDLSSQFPGEVAYWTGIVQRVEREIQAREPGFQFRTFQVRDLARLLVKVGNKLGGLLAWEMGLGKALGLGVIARSLELSGRLWDGCALFTMPQDLVPQFSAEMLRFFGVELVPVGRAGRSIEHRPGCPADGARAPVACDCASRAQAPRRLDRALAHGQPETDEPRPAIIERTAVEVAEMVRARRAAAKAAKPSERDSLPVPKVWAVTWFEALAVTGRLDEEAPPVNVAPLRRCVQDEQPEVTEWDYRRSKLVVVKKAKPAKHEWIWLTSSSLCPRCGAAPGPDGWNGRICSAQLRGDGTLRERARLRAGWARGDAETAPKRCGYVHRKVLRKPAYSVLARTFAAVFVDEGTKIQGDTSLTSKALRAFKPAFRCLATGTPMKNYVHQLFWLLWWALGDSTPRFPYSYRGGQEKFTQDFGVTETAADEDGRKARGARPRVLPEVSNLLYLWRMLCGAVVRRRMDEVGSVVGLDGAWTCRACRAPHVADVGEPWTKPAVLVCSDCGEVADAIVPLLYKPVEVPFGVGQKKHYAHWLDKQKFASWFLAAHPDSPLQQSPKAVELLAASIGQLVKLEYATVDPTGDRDWSGASSWTPSRLKVLQLAEEKARAGHRVLFGSCLVAPARWVAEQLSERGLKAVHMTDVDEDGRARTRSPKQRAKAVMDFRAGKVQVLCASLNAMALGHNLDVASVVIIEGLPWDFAVMDQFIKRARRLTSKRPVEVYILMPQGSLATRKWELLRLKTDSSDLALDGKIAGRVESRIDKAAVLAELTRRGVKVDGTEVPEDQVRQAWHRPVRSPKRTSAA